MGEEGTCPVTPFGIGQCIWPNDLTTVQIVDQDHWRILAKFGKDPPFYFWVFELESWHVGSNYSVKSMLILLNISMVKFLKILNTILIVTKQIFQIFFDKMNFFLIIISIKFKIYILINSNCLFILPWEFLCIWMQCNWPRINWAKEVNNRASIRVF